MARREVAPEFAVAQESAKKANYSIHPVGTTRLFRSEASGNGNRGQADGQASLRFLGRLTRTPTKKYTFSEWRKMHVALPSGGRMFTIYDRQLGGRAGLTDIDQTSMSSRMCLFNRFICRLGCLRSKRLPLSSTAYLLRFQPVVRLLWDTRGRTRSF